MANVVLGVSGSIAAYKAPDLTSKLVQAGHGVDVILTRAAQHFVRPLAFAALTHRPPLTDRVWVRGDRPHDHLALVGGAALLVVAPSTANLLGKFAHGIADDVLSASYLAAPCPVLLAPAMNVRMWEHPRVRHNVETLRGDGVSFVGPEPGWLSEGEEAMGRMSETSTILVRIEALLAAGRGTGQA